MTGPSANATVPPNMCGVIGLVYERERADLGVVAGELLRTLEYRGYDSTGAALQRADGTVTLRKGVGAPSVMVDRLGITSQAGRVLCGQVRWATFGAVNDENAQPHEVRCKTHLYGAHNGNVTNCDRLKQWLLEEGHDVRSDNDGEMVVHVVEHFFGAALAALPEAERRDAEPRRRAMRGAIASACGELAGSFAAVIVDPITQVLFGIKQGSSFYFGVGESEEGGRFAIASSDLSSVLKVTRVLVRLSEGEVVEFDAENFTVFGVGDELVPREREPARSRLRSKDTVLAPGFGTYMAQEIHAQTQTCRDVLRMFDGGSAACRAIGVAALRVGPDDVAALERGLETLFSAVADDAVRAAFDGLRGNAALASLVAALPHLEGNDEAVADSLCSAENALFADVLRLVGGHDARVLVRALDAWLERHEVDEYRAVVDALATRCHDTRDRGGRVFLVCCGTSFHAAKAAALFFGEFAGFDVLPLLPGEFRGQHAETLRDGDLFVAVSQSGETKDLVDVLNQVIASGKDIGRVALVNNINSTLAQEKAELVLPLHCGPEVAVPATKSFINQLTVFYALALRLGAELRGEAPAPLPVASLPALLERTLTTTADDVDAAAELLYLAPSMHILATRLLAIAKEGALKIREVVLNHTEGIEGSEFKHGPNTILGFNTLFGPKQVQSLLVELGAAAGALAAEAAAEGVAGQDLSAMIRAAVTSPFGGDARGLTASQLEVAAAAVAHIDPHDALYADYPLVFITGPDARDVALTVSQLNTHKIRGALPVVIAEEDAALREAAQKPPAGHETYQSAYIALPETGSTVMTAFSATVVLQRLALAMSEKKAAYLDAHGIRDHGVHPDVPKNVSKSITVD